MRRTLLTFALSIIACLPASAQQLKLSFNDGLVSIDATSVPLRTLLVEWGKLGGTKVIGGERVAGAPLTLKLENVPESRALEIVMRSVAGYMAAPRAAAVTGASMYDRILVMATSAAPATAARPAGNAPTAGAPAANQRFVPPRPAPADEVEPEEEEDPNPPNPPVFSFPQPGQNGFAQPGMFQNAPPGGQPQVNPLNPNSGAPQSITINPAPKPVTAPTFGSPVPGMINVPPQQPPQPGTMVRPPGGGA